MYPCFLLHTDTPYRLFEESLSLDSPHLQCGIPKDTPFCVVYAIWSSYRRTPAENLACFFQIRGQLLQKLESALLPSFFSCILSVEDASILENDLSRLSLLSKLGVRTLALLWKGQNEIGGAWDTECGLSPFGKAVVREAIRLRILPDISHASLMSAYDVLAISEEYGVPLFASHSNARAVCPHRRNLTDDLFLKVSRSGGLVGLCFAPEHLTERPCATIIDILRHTEHFLALGGADTLALGSDFDGIDTPPRGLSSLAFLSALADEYARIGYSDALIYKIFYGNANRFFEKHFSDVDYHFFKK